MQKLGIIFSILFLPFFAHASCGVVTASSISTSTILYATNVDRCQIGEKALKYNTILAKVAQVKADDMAKRSYFSHQNPEGQSVWPSVKKTGYSYYYVGENLAQGFTNNLDLNTAWLKSPTHKAVITNRVYQDIGIGVSGSYVVVLFGTRI